MSPDQAWPWSNRSAQPVTDCSGLGFEAATQSVPDREAAERMFATAGAVVLGRTIIEVGIGTWGDDDAFGMPSFVLTNRPHDEIHRGPTTFYFVTRGLRNSSVPDPTP